MKKHSFWRATRRNIARQGKDICILFVIAMALAYLTLPKTTEPHVETPPVHFTPVEPVQTPTTTLIKRIPVQVAKWTQEQETLVEQKLSEKFTPEDARIALAVLKQESHLNTNATGYNCFYDDFGNVQDTRSTTTRSKSCLPEHREHAWSLDCGIGQNNFVGVKSCPEYTRDLEWSITKMAEMHAERGFKPWVAYTKGLYKSYLE